MNEKYLSGSYLKCWQTMNNVSLVIYNLILLILFKTVNLSSAQEMKFLHALIPPRFLLQLQLLLPDQFLV